MRIITDLESTPRRLYTGTIGYLSPHRKARFSVAIRTLLMDRQNQKAEYGIGGGIVWDSTDAEEYSEALLKARVLTEFTIGNLVVELDGQYLTLPLSCGVLPGTFRAHLLETGQVLERALLIEQLKNCTKVFRVNSIRKWQPAELQASLSSYDSSEISRRLF